MIEEGGLDPPEPARNLQLSLVPHAALATEDEKPVLADVADDLGRRFSRVNRVEKFRINLLGRNIKFHCERPSKTWKKIFTKRIIYELLANNTSHVIN